MDTGLSTHPGLEGLWADVPQRAVSPLAVVIGFDVFKHGFTHLGAAREALAVDALDLQACLTHSCKRLSLSSSWIGLVGVIDLDRSGSAWLFSES